MIDSASVFGNVAAMVTQIRGLRSVVTLDEPAFGTLLGKVLSPARPLQSEEFLRGREVQLGGIKEALYQPGRHVLIHGFRGVGKSSLAQTAAYALSTGADPVVLGCDEHSTFGNVIREVFEEATSRNPTLEKTIKDRGLSFERFGIGAKAKVSREFGRASAPGSVNEAVRLMQFLCETYAENPVIVIDEFDQIKSEDEQVNFTNFVKQVSDKHVPARFIFCGTGESIDAIMAAHGSADRYFHTVDLGRLPWEARFEIVTSASETLGIDIDNDTVVRIARISDGFPHYVHFISEKLFWRIYHAGNGGRCSAELFERAMADAASSMEMKLRAPYDKATQKYSNEYARVLWAAADGHELKRRSSDIYESYLRIAGVKDPMDREHFNQRINSLKRENHGTILTGSRQGWYEFTEKVIRGYVRLRAEQEGVMLESEHPAARRRMGHE